MELREDDSDVEASVRREKIQARLRLTDVSVIGKNYLFTMFREKIPILNTSFDNLRSSGGSNIEVLGEIKIPCEHKGNKHKISFQVSAIACSSLGLIKYCGEINTTEKSAQYYVDEADKIKIFKYL